jgi:hypothetical protein
MSPFADPSCPLWTIFELLSLLKSEAIIENMNVSVEVVDVARSKIGLPFKHHYKPGDSCMKPGQTIDFVCRMVWMTEVTIAVVLLLLAYVRL